MFQADLATATRPAGDRSSTPIRPGTTRFAQRRAGARDATTDARRSRVATATGRPAGTDAAGSGFRVAAATRAQVCRITRGTTGGSTLAATIVRRAIRHDGAAEDGIVEIGGVGGGRSAQIGIDQAGSAQVGLGQVSPAEIGPPQIGAGDIAAGAVESAGRREAGQVAAANVCALLWDACSCSPAGLLLRRRLPLVSALAVGPLSILTCTFALALAPALLTFLASGRGLKGQQQSGQHSTESGAT